MAICKILLPPLLLGKTIKLLRYASTLGIGNRLTLNQIVGLGLPFVSAHLREARERGIAIPTRLTAGPHPGADGREHRKLAQLVQDIEEGLIGKAQGLADEYETSRNLVLFWACHHGLEPAAGWIERNGYNQFTLASANRGMSRYVYSRNHPKNMPW